MVAFNKSTPRRTKTIKGHALTVPAPIVEGHVLTAVEAGAMNGLFAENIGNNIASKLEKAIADNGGVADIAALQTIVDDYAATYDFGMSRTSDPVEKAAKDIARETVKTQAGTKGVKLDSKQLTEFTNQYFETNRDELMKLGQEEVNRKAKITGGLGAVNFG